ncbi:unnamed protein product [Closterium sp. Naga37s-1]|nr:unnamed protein product [Closterium sp. Naga37s-1]
MRPFVAQIGDNTSPPISDPSPLLTRRLGFTIKYERDDPIDPRELSELPDVRLWFVRLDAAYPWLPAVLDWRAGELGRYAAMLVPHQCSSSNTIQCRCDGLLWAQNHAMHEADQPTPKAERHGHQEGESGRKEDRRTAQIPHVEK